MREGQPMLSASTTVAFPRIAAFLEAILESLAAHDMTVAAEDGAHVARSPLRRSPAGAGGRDAHHPCARRNGAGAQPRPACHHRPHRLCRKDRATGYPMGGRRCGRHPPARSAYSHGARDRGAHAPHAPGVFDGADLGRFATGEQIHTRLLFQPEDAVFPEWPLLDDAGLIQWPGGTQRLGSRVYTLRHVMRQPAGSGSTSSIMVARGRAPAGCGAPAPATWWALWGLPPMAETGPADDPGRRRDGLPGIARILEDAPEERAVWR